MTPWPRHRSGVASSITRVVVRPRRSVAPDAERAFPALLDAGHEVVDDLPHPRHVWVEQRPGRHAAELIGRGNEGWILCEDSGRLQRLHVAAVDVVGGEALLALVEN